MSMNYMTKLMHQHGKLLIGVQPIKPIAHPNAIPPQKACGSRDTNIIRVNEIHYTLIVAVTVAINPVIVTSGE